MANIWKPQDREVYISWIEAIKTEASDNITSWETDFVDSIEQYLNRKSTLTEIQAEILERIYTEHTN
jgi:hypothetical protein